ncbi:hypothetical protein CYLTODRAFT_426067 [Cylindrobasidium torrendii FP15055 ss-10]|uniref:Arrestin-like N-terminal domain-containing protein n=1 Tax=Cylindrobasidium torrendii FP15055 ss-10 TaxID=1314674 RepID=A0A0D7AZU6_9AGAR|nr:hypothetical protein CYLTODRAFT_426067 [Cylindrobasidium torrendii FP15055 ss-10]
MSNPALPPYAASHTPAYTSQPRSHEQRLSISRSLRPRPSGEFVKESRSHNARLRLGRQEQHVELPIYGAGGVVDGIVEAGKPDGITSVEVKIEGRLRVQETGAGGTAHSKLCYESHMLWMKETPTSTPCPPQLPFRFHLPPTFLYLEQTYPLPPTYNVALDGIPGFNGIIEYSVTAVLSRPALPLPFGKNVGNIVVTTPFIYLPRSRPATPLPARLTLSRQGYIPTPDWREHTSVISSKVSSTADIHARLYIPSSRIFSLTESIPVHLIIETSSYAIAQYLPYGPTASFIGNRATRVSLVRQTAADVRHAMISSTKTYMWRVDTIGHSSFTRTGDGPTWLAFDGEISLREDVGVAGFKAGGLSVKDYILFEFAPSDPAHTPFVPTRQLVPVKMTTDPWTADGLGAGRVVLPSPEETEEDVKSGYAF